MMRPFPRSPWNVILEETGQSNEESTGKQTAIVITIEITWMCPADRADRFLFHSSPDEDGIQRAIWNLRWQNKLPLALGDSNVEYGDWGLSEDDAPVPVAARNIEIKLHINFPDSRNFPA